MLRKVVEMFRSLLALTLVSVAVCQPQVAPQQPVTQQPSAQQPPPQQLAAQQPQPVSPATSTPPPAPKTPTVAPPTADPGASVAPTQPVITAKGVCPNRPPAKTAAGAPKPAPAPCVTVITKGQF